jgi:alcohol dehydrogenase
MPPPPVRRTVTTDQALLIGPGAAGQPLAGELATRGWGRVYVLASASAVRAGQLDALRAGGLAAVEVVGGHTGVRGHAPVEDTQRLAREARELEFDAIVALGGGSVSDTAKGLAAVLAEGGEVVDHCYTFTAPDDYRPKRLDRPKLPLVAVPTTLSGAELTGGAGATTPQGVKRALWDDKLAARVAVYDADVIGQVPAPLLVSTGMNALAHCVEAAYSLTANALSTAVALHGARLLAVGLRAVARGRPDPSELDQLASGTALAGLAILNARVAIGHGVCHVLGGRYGVPHGVANSVMLPAAMTFNLPATRPAQEQVVRALAGLGDAAPVPDPAAVVDDLRREIGAPRRLRDLGLMDYADLDDVAEACMHMRGTYFNPRPVRAARDVRDLLELAW